MRDTRSTTLVHTTSSNTSAPLVHTTSISVQGNLQDWANHFYQAKKVEGISAYTLTFYQQQLSHFLRYCDAQVIVDVEDVTPTVIRQFMLWHKETGHNPGGQHAAYRVLRTFLLWYEKEDEPDNWKNPIHKVKAPKLPQEPLDPVSIDDVQALIDTCKTTRFLDVRDKAMLLFLLDTGARAREALLVDLDEIDVLVGQVLIRQGKGRKPRPVFLGKAARKALRAYLKTRRDDCPALWISDNRDRLSYSGMRGMIVRRAQLAGVPTPTPHSFRRAFAINMLRAGVDLVTLSRIMGHTTLKILERYLKQIPDDLRIAHAKGSPVDNEL